jgi:hypothetical protein
VEDPAHVNFSSSVDSGSQVTLNATAGPIPSGTDIGYQTINGPDAANSTFGWAFDPAFDFSVSIGFDLSFSSANGGFAIGMGTGEDRNGANSAGMTLLTQNGIPGAFVGAARINDVTQTPQPLATSGQLTGRFLVSYTSSSGDIALGLSTDGDDTAEETATFSAIQNSWNDAPLMVSFFARGDNGLFSWNSGTAETAFTDFHVISGTPFSVPEPSSVGLLSLSCVVLLVSRHLKRKGR